MRRLVFLSAAVLLLLPSILWAQNLIEADLAKPFKLQLSLPEPGLKLVGLPDFGHLALLETPVIEERKLKLRLLPLQAGELRLPPLSLQQGSRHWLLPARTIRVRDPLGANAEPAPLRKIARRSEPGFPKAHLLWLLLPPVWVAWRRRRITSSSLPANSPDRLRRLQRKLQPLPISSGRQQLLRLVLAWRFGPFTADEETLRQLEYEVDRLEAGA